MTFTVRWSKNRLFGNACNDDMSGQVIVEFVSLSLHLRTEEVERQKCKDLRNPDQINNHINTRT